MVLICTHIHTLIYIHNIKKSIKKLIKFQQVALNVIKFCTLYIKLSFKKMRKHFVAYSIYKTLSVDFNKSFKKSSHRFFLFGTLLKFLLYSLCREIQGQILKTEILMDLQVFRSLESEKENCLSVCVCVWICVCVHYQQNKK